MARDFLLSIKNGKIVISPISKLGKTLDREIKKLKPKRKKKK